jgi:predicted RND superfamily exporter protein
MTITGALTERGIGWKDPKMLRRGLALVAFSVGALSGALLILNVGVAAALSFGLLIIIGSAVGAHLVSRTSADCSAPRSP